MKQLLFPLDIIGHIIKYFPVTDRFKIVLSLCPGAQTDSIRKLVNEYDDLSVFFEDIIDKVPYFMDLMRIAHISLVGIRAFSYFHNVDIDANYPWQFVSETGSAYSILFIHYLYNNGVKWGKINHIDITSEFINLDVIDGYMLTNGIKLHIQLIWTNFIRTPIFSIIQSIGTTPLQCIVGPYQSIDPYGKLHAQHKYRLWKLVDNRRLEHDIFNIYDAMNFCRSRSMSAISYETHRNYDPYKRFTPLLRGLANDESVFGESKKYIGLSNLNNISFRDINVIEDSYSIKLEIPSNKGAQCFEQQEVEYLSYQNEQFVRTHIKCRKLVESFKYIHDIGAFPLPPIPSNALSNILQDFMPNSD